MVAAANLVEVAALVGDTARATMLAAHMGGQWLTATELAYRANVSRSTASGVMEVVCYVGALIQSESRLVCNEIRWASRSLIPLRWTRITYRSVRYRGQEYGLMATKRAPTDHAVRNKTAQPTVKHVIGPCGDRLTLADLPLPDTKRWVVRRKAEVVAAVRGGLLSLDEACSRYALDSDEILSWQHCIDCFGIAGLRATRTQFYLRRLARPKS